MYIHVQEIVNNLTEHQFRLLSAVRYPFKNKIRDLVKRLPTFGETTPRSRESSEGPSLDAPEKVQGVVLSIPLWNWEPAEQFFSTAK
jgi:hypothetical protein